MNEPFPFEADRLAIESAVLAAHTAYREYQRLRASNATQTKAMEALLAKQDAYEEVCKSLDVQTALGYAYVQQAIEEGTGPLTQVVEIVSRLN